MSVRTGPPEGLRPLRPDALRASASAAAPPLPTLEAGPSGASRARRGRFEGFLEIDPDGGRVVVTHRTRPLPGSHDRARTTGLSAPPRRRGDHP